MFFYTDTADAPLWMDENNDEWGFARIRRD